MSDASNRNVAASDIRRWDAARSPLVRVRTDQDAVVGGLAMAMAPVVVSWPSSSAGFDPDDYYVLRRVNAANNPVGGHTMLGGLKVFADAVEAVEFVMVISKVAHRESPGGHAMLRFIFREDRRPTLLDRGGDPVENDSAVEDIVLSWEAWRPPLASFDPVKGLDPKTYALTPRCYVGSVRCLADSILDRPWHCYPLKLPAVEHAGAELLYVSLALADAVWRQTVLNLLQEHIERGRSCRRVMRIRSCMSGKSWPPSTGRRECLKTRFGTSSKARFATSSSSARVSPWCFPLWTGRTGESTGAPDWANRSAYAWRRTRCHPSWLTWRLASEPHCCSGCPGRCTGS